MGMYHSIVVGGTFDQLHAGHKALLGKAFAIGEHVTIGLTTDVYVTHYKLQMTHDKPASPAGGQIPKSKKIKQKEQIQSFKIRKEFLMKWLTNQGWGSRYTIVPLEDPYGPLLKGPETGSRKQEMEFDAIVVSDQTRKTAREINRLREQQGLSPIVIISIPMIQSEDAERISSTRVRNREIDPDGRLILPDTLREALRVPIGPVIPPQEQDRVIRADAARILATVGDTTTQYVVRLGILPRLAVIDFFTRREPFHWTPSLLEALKAHRRVTKLQSGPGYISAAAYAHIRMWSQRCEPELLIIDGEEDLLVLPLMIEAPEGTVVYYGQRDAGVVRVVINGRVRRVARQLLRKFSSF